MQAEVRMQRSLFRLIFPLRLGVRGVTVAPLRVRAVQLLERGVLALGRDARPLHFQLQALSRHYLVERRILYRARNVRMVSFTGYEHWYQREEYPRMPGGTR